MTLFRKLMLIWLAMIGVLFIAIMGLWWIDSSLAVRVLHFASEVLTTYAWAFLVWRLLIYAGLFFGWPAIGCYLRKRTANEWSVQSIQDFNRYRWRLLIILLIIEAVVIQQIPFKGFST